MKTPQLLFFLLILFTSIHALALPTLESASHLFKRKGGGGGGGRGGGGVSSGGGSRGSSSSGGSRGSSGGTRGVGPQPRTFGSGAYYGGGSATPYKSGSRSPGGVAPVLIGAGAFGFLGAGAFAYGAYFYPYHGYYTYHNNSANENQTRPAECYCGRFSDCGCENRNETDYINSIANNASIARVQEVNGTSTLLIDGTLPNGTTVAEENAAAALKGGVWQFGGWAIISGAVAWGVWLL